MNCPRCGSVDYVKDGIVTGRQRYQCKRCRYRYTVAKKSDVRPLETRQLALAMYTNGTASFLLFFLPTVPLVVLRRTILVRRVTTPAA